MKTPWPFRNLGLKLLSLGIGVLLWISVSGEATVERGLRAPLELQQFPAGLEIQGEAPSTVDVRVRGTSGALSRVGPGDLVAVLDLQGARAGNRLFAMTPEQVRSPYGVEVVQVTPSTIALALENSLTREVPVVPSVEGAPKAGYVVVGKPVVTPDRVEIVGPALAVKRAVEAGALPDSKWTTLGRVITGAAAIPAEGLVVFKSVGSALQDLALAARYYERVGAGAGVPTAPDLASVK